MPIVADYQAKPEAVGEILVKVQDDLLQLKEKIVSNGELRNLDLSALENAISKTEDGIKNQTEIVLQQLNNRVNTLPAYEAQGHAGGQVSMEVTWDLQAGSKGSFAVRQHGARTRPKLDGTNGAVVLQRKAVAERKPCPPQDFKGPTPGQQFKENFVSRTVNNPYNPKNRDILNESYGIQLPLIVDRKPKFNTQTVMKGSTVEPLAVLPKANRVDPQEKYSIGTLKTKDLQAYLSQYYSTRVKFKQLHMWQLLPPPITEEDAQKGIISLMDRGFIPPAAQLTLEPSPVRHKMAPLHDPKEKEGPRIPPNVGDQYGAIKLDPPGTINERIPSPPKPNSPAKFSSSPDLKSRISSSGRHTSATKLKTPVTVRTLELQPMAAPIEAWVPGVPMRTGRVIKIPPPTTPASGQDFKDKNHRFAIQNGKTREQSQEYMVFKQHYCLSWGSIVTTLKHLERMLTNYAVPIAFVHGDKLADLSIEFELEKVPTVDDLLTVIVNREDVENLINKPGRRYVGPRGQDCAAARIQATWHMYQERGRYLEYRRKKWAAGVICISWVMSVKMSKVRKQLAATRMDQLENFRKQARIFSRSWDRIRQSRRTIIHIPSLGYSTPIRDSLNNFYVWQNMQMARLCDIKDPNVDVIFVSPVHVNEEMKQYYAKLLGLKSAIETGNVDDQADPVDRYKIVVPDALKAFPAHNMCLSSILKYSPRTLKRIKNLIRGKDAYIVTGVPHKDDVHIAEALGVPILCPEPEIAHLYSTKSGSKRIFSSARVAIPPGEYDIYSLPQLQECLAQLVTDNLEVTRWLFKLDSEFDGRGIAYVDVAENLKCYPWALKEAARYGEKWSKKWAQEAAYIKIHAEIPELLVEHASPVNTKVYPTWKKFLEAFLSQGGIIEACPPSDSVTALTVDMLIEPNGNIGLVSAGDQIHADSQFSCWGMSVPQSSVEPEELNDVCHRIAESCKSRGVVGYFSIDFVTFIHPRSLQQVLWAVDLTLSYSDSLAMFQLMQFTTGGQLDPKTHFFDVPLAKREEKKSRRKRLKESSESEVAFTSSYFSVSSRPKLIPNTSRYAVMSTRLRHTNLSVVHYSVFFQMCRAHGIGYDIKEKQGTMFTLIDSFNRENMGMLTVGDNLQGALATFARNLSVIHQEISAPNMQGESNFMPVVEDIEAILGTTVQNSEDHSTEVESTELVESSTPS